MTCDFFDDEFRIINSVDDESTQEYGVFTNTGNLRDILARGVVAAKAMRKKHYADCGDFAPNHVVLVSLPVCSKLKQFVCREASHLAPVLLRLDQNSLEQATALTMSRNVRGSVPLQELSGDDHVIALPGPLPLTAFSAIHFANKTDLKNFSSSARHGEDDLGLKYESSFETSESDWKMPPLPTRATEASMDSVEGDRTLDAHMGAMAAMLARGMGGLWRHTAIAALRASAGQGHTTRPALARPVSAGVWEWLHESDDGRPQDAVAVIMRWLLEKLCAAGNWNGFPREKFLKELQEDSGGLPLAADSCKLLNDRIRQLQDVISLSKKTLREDAMLKGPFVALLDYLLRLDQYDCERYPKVLQPEHRIARIMHAVRAGWKGLTTTELEKNSRRCIVHASCNAVHAASQSGIRLSRLKMPLDHEGWILSEVLGNSKLEDKILSRKLFDPCWQTEITFPCALSTLATAGSAKTLRIPGRVKTQVQVDKALLEDFMENHDLDEPTRKACEKVMLPTEKRR